MNDHSTAYQVVCVPGRNAGAAAIRGPGGRPVLTLHLDTVDMTLHGEQSDEGTQELADFCRELAWEAAKLAAEIDPEGEPIPPDRPARCLVVLGSSGGGH
jgi:hypothetical protein